MNTADEIRGMVGVLQSVADIAQAASMTGSLREGSKVSIRHYNTILARLQALDLVAGGLFVPLDEGSNMDEIGVASAHLAAYLRRIQAGEPETGSFDEAFRKVDETMRAFFGSHENPPEAPGEKHAVRPGHLN